MWSKRFKRLKTVIARSHNGLNFCKASGVSRKLQQIPGSCSLSALRHPFPVSRPQRIGLLIVWSEQLPKDLSMSKCRKVQERVVRVRVRARARATGRAKHVVFCTVLIWLNDCHGPQEKLCFIVPCVQLKSLEHFEPPEVQV